MPQDQENKQATATATVSWQTPPAASATNQKPAGSESPGADTAGLLGQDTRPTYKLNGLDGKPLKVPPWETTLYLLHSEVLLLRMEVRQLRLDAKARGAR